MHKFISIFVILIGALIYFKLNQYPNKTFTQYLCEYPKHNHDSDMDFENVWNLAHTCWKQPYGTALIYLPEAYHNNIVKQEFYNEFRRISANTKSFDGTHKIIFKYLNGSLFPMTSNFVDGVEKWLHNTMYEHSGYNRYNLMDTIAYRTDPNAQIHIIIDNADYLYKNTNYTHVSWNIAHEIFENLHIKNGRISLSVFFSTMTYFDLAVSRSMVEGRNNTRELHWCVRKCMLK